MGKERWAICRVAADGEKQVFFHSYDPLEIQPTQLELF